MWIQIRTFDGSRTVKVDNLSKLTKVEEVRDRLVELFDVEPERQWLFYRGKQMVDGHTLYEYDVRQNDLIQIMIRPAKAQNEQNENKAPNESESDSKEAVCEKNSDDSEIESESIEIGAAKEQGYTENEKSHENRNGTEQRMEVEATFSIEQSATTIEDLLMDTNCPEDAKYKVGDYVDVRDPTIGCWFEGVVLRVTGDPPANDQNQNESMFKTENSYYYHVKYESENENDDERLTVTLESIRPRSIKTVPFTDVEIKQQVLVNFNLDEPKKRGYWYDAIVQRKQSRRTQKDLFCTVMMGRDLAPLEDCQIQFVNEIFLIEEPGNQINIKDVKDGKVEKPKLRKNKPECDACQDNPNIVCKQCWCNVCGGKDRPDLQIMCDECDLAYHITCLNPPLEKIPEEDEWYCPSCKNNADIVKAGEKLKESKKKAKMISATGKTNRDWGKGMACAGRTKVCTLVPPNHFGAIPGVEVGSLWKYRVQVSEAGVHRPHVAGIAGRESEGAFSIVLSGGYEDDHDDGEEFLYTGSGGRDLSGNKRTAEQSCDQVLTRMNMALAKNCNASVNAKDGAEAVDWKKGKPVRVVRNCKAAKHSKYAPEEGNRYDGIYKLVKYWPEKGKSGFIVWRYLFRRDDPTPAPWTKEGKKRIRELGIEMIYPDGYLDKNDESDEKKRKNDDSGNSPKKKKQKKSPTKIYRIDEDVGKLIEKDEMNEKVWQRAKEVAKEFGKQKFLDYVQEEFMCTCCQEVVCKPVTTKCLHNICKQCLQRAYKAEVYSCPSCRTDLGEKTEIKLNDNLDGILLALFPGYQAGR